MSSHVAALRSGLAPPSSSRRAVASPYPGGSGGRAPARVVVKAVRPAGQGGAEGASAPAAPARPAGDLADAGAATTTPSAVTTTTAATTAAALLLLLSAASSPAAAAADPAAAASTATTILRPLFAISELAFVVRIVMTWYPGVDASTLPWSLVYGPTEPLLAPTRRAVPPVGGVDVSPIIWFALTSLANEILVGPQGILVLLSRKVGGA